MASCSRFQACMAIRGCAEALRDKLIEIEGRHIHNMSPRGQELFGQLPVIEDCLNSGAFSYKELRELDNDGLQLLLNICINMAKKYHLSSPLKNEDNVKITPSQRAIYYDTGNKTIYCDTDQDSLGEAYVNFAFKGIYGGFNRCVVFDRDGNQTVFSSAAALFACFEIVLINYYGKYIHPLTTNEWNILKDVITITIRNLDAMISELNAAANAVIPTVSPQMKQASKVFLGVNLDSSKACRTLASSLKKIRNNLSLKTINDFKVDANPVTDTYALTYLWKSGKMVLGLEKFFNNTNLHKDTKEGTLIHEITHYWSVLGTSDITYNFEKSKELPSDKSSKKKSDNANNWEYFYEYLWNGGSL